MPSDPNRTVSSDKQQATAVSRANMGDSAEHHSLRKGRTQNAIGKWVSRQLGSHQYARRR
jgi:hypothetical protein